MLRAPLKARDALNDVSIPGSREQVLGIGAGAVVTISPHDFLFLNGYFETFARNRPEGALLNVRYVHHFPLGKQEAQEQ